jgi:hypothetical protein
MCFSPGLVHTRGELRVDDEDELDGTTLRRAVKKRVPFSTASPDDLFSQLSRAPRSCWRLRSLARSRHCNETFAHDRTTRGATDETGQEHLLPLATARAEEAATVRLGGIASLKARVVSTTAANTQLEVDVHECHCRVTRHACVRF